MGNIANKAQKFLLYNNCGDLILNDTRAKNAKDRIYASDIMMKFLESERGQKADTGERQSNIPDVSQQRELFVSFARFAHNYGKGSYGTSYEEMFTEWLKKRNK